MKSSALKILFAIFFIFIFLLIPLFQYVQPALAQTAYQPTTQQSNQIRTSDTNPDVPNNLHTYTQSVVIEVLSSATCLLAGVDPVNPQQKCLGVDPQTHKIGYVQNGGGAIGGMGQLIGMIFDIPVHTSDYFKDISSNFGFTKHAYAVGVEGYGFSSIKGLEGIWRSFLNIVYMIFVLLFVLIGLAIMFRLKVDPRTVMTLQNQIPKIIIGLLLVTFSFAIAGFLIDVMYTSIYLMTNIAAKASPGIAEVGTGVVTSTNPFQAASIATGGHGDLRGSAVGLSKVAWDPASSVGSFIKPVFENPGGRIIVGIIGSIVGNKVAGGVAKGVVGLIGAIAAPFTGGLSVTTAASISSVISFLGTGAIGVVAGQIAPEIMDGIITLIAFLVIMIAIIFALFRLWFQLISAYVFILIDIVFAPFWIALGMFPGSQLTFGMWIRDMIANLAAFPTAIVMFYLGRIFIEAFGTSPYTNQFIPPMVSNPNAPNAFGSIIGIGIILLTPNALNMTKAALKAPKFDTKPIAQAIGVGTGAPAAIPKNALQYSSQLFYLGKVPGIRGIPVIGNIAYKAAHGEEGGPPAGAAH